MDMTKVNPVDAELRANERVLWRGQPRADILLGPQDAFLIPFSLMWGGFALFWEATVTGFVQMGNSKSGAHHQAPLFFVLWGIPFVACGLYMIVGRFLHLRWAKQRTWYALTDKRIVIVNEGVAGRSVREQELTSLTTVQRNLRNGDVGTLDFVAPDTGRRRSQWPVQKLGTMAFVDIADVGHVYEILQQARQDAAKQ